MDNTTNFSGSSTPAIRIHAIKKLLVKQNRSLSNLDNGSVAHRIISTYVSRLNTELIHLIKYHTPTPTPEKTLEIKINNAFKKWSTLRIKRNKIQDTQCQEFKSLNWELGLARRDYETLLTLRGQVRDMVLPIFKGGAINENNVWYTRYETLPGEIKDQIKDVYVSGKNIYYIPFVGMGRTLKDVAGYLQSLQN